MLGDQEFMEEGKEWLYQKLHAYFMNDIDRSTCEFFIKYVLFLKYM